MKVLKYLVVSSVLIIFTALMYTSVIFFLTFENIINLYYVCVILFFIFIIYIITRIIFNKKKILIYKESTGAMILIFMVILVNINLGFISLFALTTLEKTDLNSNLYNVAKNTKASKFYYDSFNVEIYNNVKLMYGESSKLGITVVKNYIDNIEEDCERVLDKVSLQALTLKLHYNEENFKNISQELKGFSGVYFTNTLTKENTIGMLVKDSYSDILAINSKTTEFKKILRHEYVHYYFHMFSEYNKINLNSIPLWFSEGSAEYIGEAADKFNGTFPNAIIPLNSISTKEGWVSYSNKGYNVYNQGYFAIYNLVLLKGEQVIKNILSKASMVSFEDAFSEEVGMTIKEFEELLVKQTEDNISSYADRVKTQMVHAQPFNETRILALETYLEENPENINAYMDLGVMYERNKKYKEALKCCEKAVNINPYDAVIWNNIGLASLMIQDNEKAEKAFKNVIMLDPCNSSAYRKLAEILILTSVDDAVKILEEATQVDNSAELKSVLESYRRLQEGIKKEEALKEYFKFLTGNSVSVDSRKLAIIDKVLNDYYDTNCIYKYEIIKLREKLQE